MTGQEDHETTFFNRMSSTVMIAIVTGAVIWLGNSALTVRDQAQQLLNMQTQVIELRKNQEELSQEMRRWVEVIIRNTNRLDSLENVKRTEERPRPGGG